MTDPARAIMHNGPAFPANNDEALIPYIAVAIAAATAGSAAAARIVFRMTSPAGRYDPAPS